MEHVGSTAVPELSAKPVLDIAVRLSEHADVRQVVERLRDLRLEYRGDKGSRGGHLFVAYSATGLPTCHIHVLTHGDPAWTNYLRFRELLRSDKQARERYMQAKHDLAARHASDRGSYTRGKESVVQSLLDPTAD